MLISFSCFTSVIQCGQSSPQHPLKSSDLSARTYATVVFLESTWSTSRHVSMAASANRQPDFFASATNDVTWQPSVWFEIRLTGEFMTLIVIVVLEYTMWWICEFTFAETHQQKAMFNSSVFHREHYDVYNNCWQFVSLSIYLGFTVAIKSSSMACSSQLRHVDFG